MKLSLQSVFFFEPFSYNLLAPIRPLSRISFLSLPCIRLRRSLRFLFLSLPLAGFAPFIRLVRSLPSVGAEPKSGAVFRRSRTMRRTFCLFSCGRNVNAVAGFEECVKSRRAVGSSSGCRARKANGCTDRKPSPEFRRRTDRCGLYVRCRSHM